VCSLNSQISPTSKHSATIQEINTTSCTENLLFVPAVCKLVVVPGGEREGAGYSTNVYTGRLRHKV